MSESHTDTFFCSFRDSFRQVLSQCSGTEWTADLTDSSDAAELVWVHASASGSLSGDFAFGLTPDSGIQLAQVLTGEAGAAFGRDEKEAATELLRQVCGLSATSLANQAGQPTISVKGEATLVRTPAEQRTVRLTAGDRTASIVLAITSELAASLVPPAPKPKLQPASQVETDRPALQEALSTRNLDLLLDVQLGVRLRFGSRRLKLREILEFHPGIIVELDRQVQEPVDLLVDSKLIARGEVVVIDGNYGLKVTDVLSPRQCVEALY